ncbi:type I secretion C-terminal target domain-containing protein, partial [Psychromonas sp. RZ22]|uniref:Ig-like domain-containing protein n=1 Tax=Psychromonas algarum TaxID=2555643 RepID=UPI0010685DEF
LTAANGSLDEDSGSVTVAFTAADVDGTVTTTASVPAEQGTVVVDNENGTYTFTPAENFNGDATITLVTTDDDGATATTTSIVAVGDVNDAPFIADDNSAPVDPSIRLDSQPGNGQVQVKDENGDWVEMEVGINYPADSEVQFVPNKDAVDADTRDIQVGTNTETASIEDWGTVNSDNNEITQVISGIGVEDVVIKTSVEGEFEVKNGAGHIGIGIGDGASGGNGLSHDETLRVDISGENINQISFKLSGIGGYFDSTAADTVRTQIVITAYREDGTVISSIETYRDDVGDVIYHNDAHDIATYTFNASEAVDYFVLGTSEGPGSYVVQEMTLSRTLTEELTISTTQSDGSIISEDVSFELTSTNADTPIDLRAPVDYFPIINEGLIEGPIITDTHNSVTIDVLNNDTDIDGDELSITHINGESVVDENGNLVQIQILDGADLLGTAELVDGKIKFTPNSDLDIDNDGKLVVFNYTATDGEFSGTADVTLTVNPNTIVNNVDDEKPNVIDQTFTYNENQPANAEVAAVNASDNVGVTAYSFAGGTQLSADGFFSIDNDGVIRITELGVESQFNDFETGNNEVTYQVIISDEVGNEATIDVSLNVEDVDIVTSDGTFAVDDNGSIVHGLAGEYWGYDDSNAANLTSLDIVTDYIDDTPANINFISTNINYAGVTLEDDNSSENNDLAKDVIDGVPTHLINFLSGVANETDYILGSSNTDAETIVKVGDGSSSDATDAIIKLTGNINVSSAGLYTFTVNHDDGFQVLIDGEKVFNFDGITAPTGSQQEITLTAGLHSVELYYWDQGGRYTLELDLESGSIADGENRGDNIWVANNLYHAGTGGVLDTLAGIPLTIDVLANDDGDELSIDSITQPEHGNVEVITTIEGKSLVIYTPTDGYIGTDSFNYTAIDKNGIISDVAVVQVNVLFDEANGTGIDTDNVGIPAPNSGIDHPDNVDNSYGISDSPSDGDDIIYGLDGDDKIKGKDGDDTIYGDAQDDTLKGNDGNDTLYGGSGEDKLEGNDGDDILYGDSQNDTLSGGSGNDYLYGGTGHDALKGGGDTDVLYGDAGNDTLDGESGDDHLFGGTGDDTLSGEDGDDTLYGGLGDDILTGGSGSDTFVWLSDETYGKDTITDFNVAEGDKLDLSDLLQGETDTSLGQYFDISFEDGNTTINVSSYDMNDIANQYQNYKGTTIVLENTQLDGIEHEGKLNTSEVETVINKLYEDGGLIISDAVEVTVSNISDDDDLNSNNNY